MSETNIQNVNFKNITQMNQVASILPTDRFLVARADQSTLGYTTYQTQWEDLSANLVDKAKNYAINTGLLTAINDIKSDSRISAVAGNVAWTMLQRIDAISSTVKNGVIQSTSTTQQTVNSNIFFKNISCDSCSVDTTNGKKVCNIQTMSNFVSEKTNIKPIFSTFFYGQQLNTSAYALLTDLIPFGQIGTIFTVMAKFKRYDNTSTTKKTVSFSIGSTTTDFIPTITKVFESGVTQIKKGTEQQYRVMYVVDTKAIANNDKLSINFCNGNYNKISLSLAIYNGDISAYKDSI